MIILVVSVITCRVSISNLWNRTTNIDYMAMALKLKNSSRVENMSNPLVTGLKNPLKLATLPCECVRQLLIPLA